MTDKEYRTQPEPVAPVEEAAAVQQTPADAAQGAPSGAGTEEPTIGMGTSLAIGCIAGTVFLIIIALLVLFLQSLM